MSIEEQGNRLQRPAIESATDINILLDLSMLIAISRFASSC